MCFNSKPAGLGSQFIISNVGDTRPNGLAGRISKVQEIPAQPHLNGG